ncbi:lytic transglycosylase domain-containing protein [Clostridium saccharoperbutylacetonicum]|jgi:soluble lytic murein transglycosylase-like protein|nr:lytic transglycosylase domain-containing protein [Clostridium saccharoperbutylacetonicum]NRT59211.1 soluble lytic murein transglycosylase-like protein [Clostridium saccharoperbutylacetonicum]NSB28400.1 soluble lytic murein transglycosylase-like protein [Clostridium saccharoperbutylacetonicum]NSB34607.1 soluble lytic murein transglycosylase-like protein [Clostridium saccharoperbutylacetonicum]NSB41889.1 soluble lytic murein transglycosylase-like protein [Clostridium saccharoperbutylacetonicum
MAINGVNQLSNEQLLAMSMAGNGQLTNDGTSSSDSANDEKNVAFEMMMKNLTDSSKKTMQNNVNKITDNKANTDKKDAKAESSDSQDKSSESEVKASRVGQTYLTGQKLEDIPMVLRNGYANYAGSKSLLANRSDADLKKIYSAVDSAAQKYGVDSNLILAIIKQESDFNPNDTSGVGAAGLMQIMPENFSSLGITNQYDVNQNINGGTKLFKEYLDQYGGSIEMALMAYNGGPGTMQKRGVLSANDLYKMPKETQNYVPKVMGYYRNGV